MADTLRHEPFCTPRPGEDRPRIERFRAERTDEWGHVASRPVVTRCQECGVQTVTG